jgi:hypothetical protein
MWVVDGGKRCSSSSTTVFGGEATLRSLSVRTGGTGGIEGGMGGVGGIAGIGVSGSSFLFF